MVLEAREAFKSSIYMELAKTISKLSKDPNTKVGSVIVKDGKILGIGYNGSPRAFPDYLVPDKHSDELINDKNTYMVHSESNAILNSIGDISGSTIYVTVFPCFECAKLICQTGISKVIYLNEYRDKNFMDISRHIFEVCNVEIYSLDEYTKEITE